MVMSASKQAFKAAIGIASGKRTAVFTKNDGAATTSVTVPIASSNLFRQLTGPEEVTIDGTEVVVDSDDFDTFGTPQRGDIINDAINGEQQINKVSPMISQGELLGFRIRFG